MCLIWSIRLLTVITSTVNAITVNPQYPVKYGTLTLTATATGSTLTWVKDTKTLTPCLVSAGLCSFSTPSSMNNSVITIDSGTSVSMISISNATQTLNGGVYEATNAISKTVIVSTLPSSVQWESQPVNGSSLATGTWIAKTPCVFPEANIIVDFTIYVDGVHHSMQRVSTYSESDACESTEKAVLAQLVLDSSSYSNQRVYIVANASHNLFPNEPYVESNPSNEVIFKGRDTTTVEMSTTTTEKQSTTTVNPSPLAFTFQTTETTEKTKTVSSTSLYETSEGAVSIPRIFVNGENIGESHLYLIVVIVISSVCGVITILAIVVIILYNCNRFKICNKCTKYVKTEESEKRTEINNGVQHTKGTASTRKEDLNIKRETTGDKLKKYDRHKNEQKSGKRIKDTRDNTETKYDFGQMGRNVYDFELIGTVDTQRNTRVTNMNEGRVFLNNEPNPINSQMNINDSLFYRQTKNSGRRMLDFRDYDHNYSRRYQQDSFYRDDNRRVHTKYPSDQHGLDSTYFYYPNDQHKSNISHSMSSYEKYWSDSLVYDTKQSYSTCSSYWY